jgi:peptidyl-prolyl cis-trans isomerase B (cyclophilin B)
VRCTRNPDRANRTEGSPVTTQQQRKAKARARYEAYVARQHAKAVRRRRRNVVLASVAGVVLVIAAGVFLWSTTTDDSTSTASNPTDATDGFTYPAAGKALRKGAPADLVLDTDHGPITIALDTTKAPNNSNSLAFLAGKGYFDNTQCHRLTTDPAGIYVLQCGDRTGTGSGGPGYTTADENLPKDTDNNYPKGTVAMAEPSGGEAGSQFFLVYKDTTLPPNYTIVGEITKGLDVVEKIAAAGVSPDSPQPGDGPPAEPITITAARIEQPK